MFCFCEDIFNSAWKLSQTLNTFFSFSCSPTYVSLTNHSHNIKIFQKCKLFYAVIDWAFRNYGNNNLSKLDIEPENCRPPQLQPRSLQVMNIPSILLFWWQMWKRLYLPIILWKDFDRGWRILNDIKLQRNLEIRKKK